MLSDDLLLLLSILSPCPLLLQDSAFRHHLSPFPIAPDIKLFIFYSKRKLSDSHIRFLVYLREYFDNIQLQKVNIPAPTEYLLECVVRYIVFTVPTWVVSVARSLTFDNFYSIGQQESVSERFYWLVRSRPCLRSPRREKCGRFTRYRLTAERSIAGTDRFMISEHNFMFLTAIHDLAK